MRNKLTAPRPKLSRWRISAYECDVDYSGSPVKQGKYVCGWYGLLPPGRLQSEIIPKLSEHAAQGKSYPFLITSHQLEEEAEVHIHKDKPQKLRISDIDFSHRRRATHQMWVAVVYSATEFKNLTDK